MKDFVLTDGGHDTQFRKYNNTDEFDGHPLHMAQFILESPETYTKVLQDFIQVGAEMVLTPTYQATIDGFQEHMGLGREKALELIKIGVKIARDAVELEKAKGNTKPVAVVGVIGPYGAYLHDGSEYQTASYVDHMTTEELEEWHRPRVEALIEAGSDCLIFGTIPALKEAEAFIRVLKQHPGVKAILSFSAQNEQTICHGEKLSDVAQCCWKLAADQILAIGVNCQHPRFSVPLLRSIKEANPDIPLFVRSNSSHERFNTETYKWELTENEKTLQEYCRDWLELGVKYIGGCCRTTVDDISSFREEIRKFTIKNK
ncbi:homocysteine S-methyltransferase YbgG-like [Homalodisca vitripennis]|uniref:homocysteine S-methyltransferase YbgG-like n=1 Tax=Homalodisca vitripennis TaxID=197043 RepID=UPI001EECDE09|nr:homocysteine S-methyltransferase YbgG-like [Homalodisca vitripennis]